jgi:hypothetical protein
MRIAGQEPSLSPSSAKGCGIDNMIGTAGSQIDLAAGLLPGSVGSAGTFFFFNLPDQISLTTGVKVRAVWAILTNDSWRTKIIVPHGVSGQFLIRLKCIIDGSQYEDTAMLTIKAALVNQSVSIIATPSPQVPTISDQADALDSHPLMLQAASLLKSGDISRARLYFELLALKGSPRAAFSLGSTYDPLFLATIPNHGVAANVDLAKRWYRLADELGQPEAHNKLVALGN